MNKCYLLVFRPRENRTTIKVEYSLFQNNGYNAIHTLPYGHSGVYRAWAYDSDMISRCYILEKFALEKEHICHY